MTGNPSLNAQLSEVVLRALAGMGAKIPVTTPQKIVGRLYVDRVERDRLGKPIEILRYREHPLAVKQAARNEAREKAGRHEWP